MLPADAQRLLDFWFDVPGGPAWNTYRRAWFSKDAAFDAAVCEALMPMWRAACERVGDRDGAPDDCAPDDCAPDDWSDTPEGACARIVLLDQIPRNAFRGDPRAFATDAAALALSRRVIALGWDRLLPTPQHRMFCYMPLQHVEDLDAQHESVRQLTLLRDETGLDTVYWAEKHRDVIARFGRFPHRNAVLGRANTDEEAAFLQEPGSSF
ncbi:DUF924 domain-containing protein [Cupriavidus pauculus]|uniref:DUF924 domain-containing protein n=1 Tax=Cupriavidus pauculus TaxID=82633 RepID=A0A5P2H3Q8_9BURK|nr:DUF924 family protein [Cupriavidus pauculus]QET02338.1 DUF924 domain-containing protein [Cupriavidus pauculus]